MKITNFQKWILKKIFRDIVTQGPHHENNIIKVYTFLYQEAKNEFTEDNTVTLNSFLYDCFKESLKRNYIYTLYSREKMKITETIERECCDKNKDLKKVLIVNYQNCYFCIHCGQWWIEVPVGMRSTLPSVEEWEKVYPKL